MSFLLFQCRFLKLKGATACFHGRAFSEARKQAMSLRVMATLARIFTPASGCVQVPPGEQRFCFKILSESCMRLFCVSTKLFNRDKAVVIFPNAA